MPIRQAERASTGRLVRTTRSGTLPAMQVLPKPGMEALNRAKHGWDLGRVGEISASPVSRQPGDRLLGYEQISQGTYTATDPFDFP